jgi:hypothetical protein
MSARRRRPARTRDARSLLRKVAAQYGIEIEPGAAVVEPRQRIPDEAQPDADANDHEEREAE